MTKAMEGEMPVYLKLEGISGDMTDKFIVGDEDFALLDEDSATAGTESTSAVVKVYIAPGDPSSVDASIADPVTYRYTVNNTSYGKGDAFIDKAFTFDGNQTSHQGINVTGKYQAMLDQADNDFGGDGKDDLATYQPDTFRQVVRKDYFATGADAGTLSRDADAAAADGPSNSSNYFTDDYSLTVIGVSSDPEFFLV
jgi:hypothetical protein